MDSQVIQAFIHTLIVIKITSDKGEEWMFQTVQDYSWKVDSFVKKQKTLKLRAIKVLKGIKRGAFILALPHRSRLLSPTQVLSLRKNMSRNP